MDPVAGDSAASTTPGSTAADHDPGAATFTSSGYPIEGTCGIVNVGSARWSVDASESGLAAPPEVPTTGDATPSDILPWSTGKNGALDAVSSRPTDSEDGGSDSASRTADLECPYYQRATGLLAILTEQIERLEAELADAQRECRRRAASVCARGIGGWMRVAPAGYGGRLLPAIQSSHKGSARRLDAS
ncbi:uncharacterized protein B0H18DRAFT_1122952 [Fomitopsis serialis]|uniref:uncharacterized protein n=1 Tax=Fomitopsis serialis TaxID=139415 RepID=UPI002007B1FE|nr:uncharacterized protein B0H18DRAFT_1122952 [Neoantrodia serialis]KAH9918596.1 hypothetical protein B0H18DRAFT_1122952 [Neoantrodia serialis]